MSNYEAGWLLGGILQSSAALIAIVGGLLVSRIGVLQPAREEKIGELRKLHEELLAANADLETCKHELARAVGRTQAVEQSNFPRLWTIALEGVATLAKDAPGGAHVPPDDGFASESAVSDEARDEAEAKYAKAIRRYLYGIDRVLAPESADVSIFESDEEHRSTDPDGLIDDFDTFDWEFPLEDHRTDLLEFVFQRATREGRHNIPQPKFSDRELSAFHIEFATQTQRRRTKYLPLILSADTQPPVRPHVPLFSTVEDAQTRASEATRSAVDRVTDIGADLRERERDLPEALPPTGMGVAIHVLSVIGVFGIVLPAVFLMYDWKEYGVPTVSLYAITFGFLGSVELLMQFFARYVSFVRSPDVYAAFPETVPELFYGHSRLQARRLSQRSDKVIREIKSLAEGPAS